MKNVVVLLVFFFSGNLALAAADCSGDSVPVLARSAQLYLNIYTVSIDALTHYSELDVSKVDPVERDLAICNTIGEARNSLMDTSRAMRDLQYKIQLRCAPGDPTQLDNVFWTIQAAYLDLKHYCFKGYDDGYRDLNILKLHIVASKKVIQEYSELLLEYQK